MEDEDIYREDLRTSSNDRNGYLRRVHDMVETGPQRLSSRWPSHLADMQVYLSNEKETSFHRWYFITDRLYLVTDEERGTTCLPRVDDIPQEGADAKAEDGFFRLRVTCSLVCRGMLSACAGQDREITYFAGLSRMPEGP